jgi:hypothetical protein
MTQRLAYQLALLALIVYFTVSARVLSAVGISYTDEGGNIFFKLHPGTYLLAAGVMARLLNGGAPIQVLWRLVWREKLLASYISGILFCVIYEYVLTGSGGLVMLFDTFLPGGMIAIALCDISVKQTVTIAAILRAILLLNAMIAVGEAIIGSHCVPDTHGATPPDGEFRAVALYDHPLTGATATMLGLGLGAPSRQSSPWQVIYALCMFAALVAFGGRVALVLAVAAAAGVYIIRLAPLAATGHAGVMELLPAAAVLLLAGPLILLASAYGLGDRLISHSYWDTSAQTRISEFHLLELLRPEQILFGCHRADMIALLVPMRLQYGVDAVENFWLVMFILLGALGFVVFALALAGLMKWLWDRADAERRIMSICVLLAVSSSNSLGHKSALLVLLVAAVLARPRAALRQVARDATRPPLYAVERPAG